MLYKATEYDDVVRFEKLGYMRKISQNLGTFASADRLLSPRSSASET